MGNHDYSAILKLGPNDLLHLGVRLAVDAAGGFVQNQHRALLEQCPRQAEKLPLTMRKECFIHLFIQRILIMVNLAGNDRPKTNPLQRIDYVVVVMYLQGVNVEFDGIGKDEWVLGEAAEFLTHK